MDDHFFLATHHPVQMKRADQRSGFALAQTPVLEQQQLLDELLDPKRDYILSAILGAPGTGKSHLVRWLWLHLPREGAGKRHVVLVRRGATLRNVIELILKDMEGEIFEKLRERLGRAAQKTVTVEATRELFISDLCIAVGPQGPRSSHVPPGMDRDDLEERDAIVEGLPVLLRSSLFMQELTRSGGIVAELVEHTVGKQGMERLGDKRRFAISDIAVKDWDFSSTDLDIAARGFHKLIRYNPELQQKSVDWINANLDWAMVRLLDLSGEDLIGLMAEVRAALQQQGKELVLLIEDLSNLQGIDNALLEALLVRPKQQEQLCPLRAVFAVTTGYYASIADNVRERVELPVTLDISEGASAASPEKLAQFAARYLNATRFNGEELRQWHEGGADDAPPNHCDKCDYQAQCHQGFGEESDIGLYPFTQRSLALMYERAREDRQHFNPRVLINVVLRRTLERGAQEIPQSNFPPPDLATTLGTNRAPLGAELTAQIERSVASPDRRRVVTLVELWGEQSQWLQADTVLEAFDLDMKPLAATITPPQTIVVAPTKTTPTEPEITVPDAVTEQVLPRELEANLKTVDAWVGGAILPERVTAVLRGILFASLQSYVDWDAEMFAASEFVGTGKMFQPASLYFEGQQTQRKNTGVSLALPLAGESRAQLALVLQGALMHNTLGHWNFADGAARLRQWANLLERCAAEVLRQLRVPQEDKNEWSSAPLAAELLAVGAAVNGKPTPSQTADEFEIEALFGEFRKLDAHDDTRSAEWKKLQNTFALHSEKLQNYVMVRALCTKGGRAKGKVVDASLFADEVRRVRSSWTLKAPVSQSPRADAKYLCGLRESLEPALEAAVEAEANACEAWLMTVERLVEPGEGRKEIQNALEAALEASAGQGLGTSTVGIKNALEGFGSVRLKECVSAAAALRGKIGVARLPLVARPELVPMRQKTARVLEHGERFLDDLENRIQNKKAEVSGSGDVAAIQAEISDSLSQLCSVFTELSDPKST